jgi:hypothetical protein
MVTVMGTTSERRTTPYRAIIERLSNGTRGFPFRVAPRCDFSTCTSQCLRFSVSSNRAISSITAANDGGSAMNISRILL